MRGEPTSREEGVRLIDEFVIPRVKQLPGFIGGYWLGDRETRKMMAITLWASAEELLESEESIEAIRNEAKVALGLTLEAVETFEVTNRA